MSFKIAEPYKEIELSRFGGLYTESDTRGLPTGSSPQNNDVDYLVSLVGIRPGLRPAIAFGVGFAAYPTAAQGGGDWLNSQNAIGAPNGKSASTTPTGAGQQTVAPGITQGSPLGVLPVSTYPLGQQISFALGSSQQLVCTPPAAIPVGDVLFFSTDIFVSPPGTPGTPAVVSVSDGLGTGMVWKPLAPAQAYTNVHSGETQSFYQVFYAVVTSTITGPFTMTVTYNGTWGTDALECFGAHNIVALDQVKSLDYPTTSPVSMPTGPITTTQAEAIFSFISQFASSGSAPPPASSAIFNSSLFTNGPAPQTAVLNPAGNFISPAGTYSPVWTNPANPAPPPVQPMGTITGNLDVYALIGGIVAFTTSGQATTPTKFDNFISNAGSPPTEVDVSYVANPGDLVVVIAGCAQSAAITVTDLTNPMTQVLNHGSGSTPNAASGLWFSANVAGSGTVKVKTPVASNTFMITVSVLVYPNAGATVTAVGVNSVSATTTLTSGPVATPAQGFTIQFGFDQGNGMASNTLSSGWVSRTQLAIGTAGLPCPGNSGINGGIFLVSADSGVGSPPIILGNATILASFTLVPVGGLTLNNVPPPGTAGSGSPISGSGSFGSSVFACPPFAPLPAPLSSQPFIGGNGSGGGCSSSGLWIPTNILQATVSVCPNSSGEMLVASLGLAIPRSATITGLEVTLNARATTLPANIAAIFGSYVGGEFDVASEWEQAIVLNNIDAPIFLGGADDLWGGVWTPDEVNSPWFSLGIVGQAGMEFGGLDTIGIDTVQVTVYYTVASGSTPLLLTGYNFNAPPTAIPTGIELLLGGYSTSPVPVIVQLVLNGVPIGQPKSVILPQLPGITLIGSLTDTWSVAGLQSIITQPGFGVSITADEGSTTFIESAQLVLSVGPSGAPFFGYMKSAALTGGQSLTLALDSTGNLWQEDTINRPGIMSAFYTSITPNSLAASETIAGREFFNFFNFAAQASDQPRAWDGTNLDRISQCGPGVGPSILVDNAAYNIAPSPFGLTQPFAPVTINFYEWGAAPSEGGSGKPGTLITIYGPTNGPSSFINNINIGDNLYFLGLHNTQSGVNPNGTFTVVAFGKFIRGSGNINYYISVVAPSTQFQSVQGQSGATYQKTVGFVQLLNPIPPGLIQVGSQLTIAGATPIGWDQTFTIIGTPTQGQLLITSTVLIGNIATYTYVIVSGVGPGWQANETVTIGQQLVDTNGNLWQVTAGTTFITGGSMPPFVTSPQTDGGVTWTKVVGGSMLVTVFNTNNGGGIFNVSSQQIASATATTFTVSIVSPDIPAAAEQGQAFSGQGTIFEIDPGANTLGTGQPGTNPILGNGGGGTVVIAGLIAPGERYAILMFQTRNGLITPASPPVQFFTSQSTNGFRFANLATGPPDVIARIAALTPAGAGIGGPYFYIENDVVVPNLTQGGFSIFNKTVIPDNVSGTSNLINFSDAVLLTGVEVTVQGNNALQQRELGASVKPILYASRAFYLGEQTKEDAFINTSFDGGIVGAAPNIPAGWNVDLALNVLMQVRASQIFGGSVYVLNNTGATFNPSGFTFATAHQGAYQNIFQVPIVQPNTAYSIRAQIRSLTGAVSGNLVFSFFSPTMGEWKFSVPLNTLTNNFQYFSGPLNNPLWTTVPTDLQLRFYPQDMPNNTDFEIDRFDVFFTEEPVYQTQLAASYVEDYEAIDGVTGSVDTSGETAQAQTNAFEWNDSLYITTAGRTMTTQDNESTEPAGWKIRTISEEAGCFGPLAAARGEEYVVQASQRGFYIFDGGNHEKISQEIQQVWNLIYKPARKTVWVLNDLVQKRFMIGVPMVTPNLYLPNAPVNNNPTTPNVVLMMSYLGMETAKEIAASAPIHVSMFTGNLLARDMVRKWTIWQIASPYATSIGRPNVPEQLWFGGTIGAGKIYNLDPTATDDDGNIIPELYTTFAFSDPATNQGLNLGSVRKLYPYMSLLIEGGGAYVLTAFPETLRAPAPYPIVAPPKKLKNPALSDPNVPLNITGNRVFLQFAVDGNLGSNFILKNIVVACIRDTKMPVSGIDTT